MSGHVVCGSILFVNVTLGTKRSTAMVHVIKPVSEDNFSWDPCGGNAHGQRKVVQSHDNNVKKVDNKFSR
jgi:hypothetical protein